MRRKLMAATVALVALTAFAPGAGAEGIGTDDAGVEERADYICIRSRLILGDPVCIKYYPGS